MKFLSYDSKFSQIILKLCYSCCLNFLWLLCCLPIFTIGASTTALYYCTLKIAEDHESNILPMFFKSFKENFKQATTIWMILLGLGLLLAGDVYVVIHLRSAATGLPAIFWTLNLALVIVACVAYVIEIIFVFPLIARVSNTNFAMMRNAFLIGIRYLFCSIVVFGIHVAMFYVVVNLFTPLIIFGEGLCALISSYSLLKVINVCSYDPDQLPEAEA